MKCASAPTERCVDIIAAALGVAALTLPGCGGVRPGTQPDKPGSVAPATNAHKAIEDPQAPLINGPSAPLVHDPDKSPRDDSPNYTGPK